MRAGHIQLGMLVPRPRSRSSYRRGEALTTLPTEANAMATRKCSIQGCDTSESSRGLCARCYRRESRNGSLSDHPSRISTKRHSLSDVDEASATATCSVCGPTRIRVRKSRATHECMTVRNRNRNITPRNGGRAGWLRRTYSITMEEYDRLKAQQGDACAICLTTDSGARAWHVDHDHACCPGRKSCGECVRGLLCHRCNTGIGYLRDSTDSMERAIAYLT